MPKRLLTILAVVLLTVALLAGCGPKAPSTEIPEIPPSSPTSPAPGPEVPTPENPSEPAPPPLVISAPSTLTILSISSGEVFVMRAGSADWIKADAGISLEVGDSVKSGANSKAEITFFDGSTIELEAGTQIQVTSLAVAADTGSTTILLKQEVGKTISRVTKLADPASRYEVETPACIAAVRGSIMQVEVVDGKTWVTCIEGNVWVIANGVALKVPEGQTCLVVPGGAPELLASGGPTGGEWSVTSTVASPYITLSQVASNDDGSQLDPEEEGAWEIISDEPIWQGARYDKDVAATTITGVNDNTITFSIDNGYPGYRGSAGLIIENTGGSAMQVSDVAVIIATPAGGSPSDLLVTCTGALDEASPQVIAAGARAVGGVHFQVEQSAVQGGTYNVEVVISFVQSL
jgi:hypothetical protein